MLDPPVVCSVAQEFTCAARRLTGKRSCRMCHWGSVVPSDSLICKKPRSYRLALLVKARWMSSGVPVASE